MDEFQELKLIDYGFVYHRDDQFPLDDINWFLLKWVTNTNINVIFIGTIAIHTIN